jgi:hypothetical protein
MPIATHEALAGGAVRRTLCGVAVCAVAVGAGVIWGAEQPSDVSGKWRVPYMPHKYLGSFYPADGPAALQPAAAGPGGSQARRHSIVPCGPPVVRRGQSAASRHGGAHCS